MNSINNKYRCLVTQSPPFKKNPIELDPSLLSQINVFDLLPEAHDCYVYNDIFKQLDTHKIESKFKIVGQNAYHPRLILSILIYAYSNGVFSSREIERLCRQDLAFMYLSRMNCPNFRVLSDFRKDNLDYFHDCFKQTVRLALELKLASLGHISLDGSKFKANSSKHKAMSYGRLKDQEVKLTKEIEELIKKAANCDDDEDQSYKDKTGYEIPEDLTYKKQRLDKIKAAKKAIEKREEAENPGKAIDDKKQISFADKEARIMGKKGNFDYSYNAQINVDSDNQIIVGQHLSQHANDKQEVEQSLKSMKEATNGQLPDKMSADNGYMSGDNLQVLEDSGVDSYIAIDKGEKSAKIALEESGRKLVKADFEYSEEEDQFSCPDGKKLFLKQETKDGKKIYQGDAKVCSTCPYSTRCCKSTKGEARTISTDNKEPLRQKMRVKMEQQDSQNIYKERKVIVEPVFGQIKNTGFKGFSVRGKEKTAGEFSLVCASHNIKKIAKSIMTGLVRSISGNLVANHA